MATPGLATSTPQKQSQAIVSRSVSFRTLLSRSLAFAFVAAILAPLVGTWLHWDSSESRENRRLASLPEFSLNYRDMSAMPDQFLDYYRDHFGFRNMLTSSVAVARLRSLHQDTDGSVLIGKSGWLFYRPAGDMDLMSFRGINPMSPAALDKWQQLFERRHAYLAARGIPLLVVVAPDKQTIYPEFLPDSAAILVHHSRLDQLIDRLRETRSPVQLLDLRPALLAAKNSDTLYFKTDSHWNDLGAYAGYRRIVQSLNSLSGKWKFAAHPREDFIEKSSPYTRGDLAKIMHMADQYPDTLFTLTSKQPFFIPPVAHKAGVTAVTEVADSKLPSLIFFHDSFGESLIPFLGPHFRRTVYAYYNEMHPSLIEQEKPDIVIDEIVERELYKDPPPDPPELAK